MSLLSFLSLSLSLYHVIYKFVLQLDCKVYLFLISSHGLNRVTVLRIFISVLFNALLYSLLSTNVSHPHYPHSKGFGFVKIDLSTFKPFGMFRHVGG
jgi:hypothetical protein